MADICWGGGKKQGDPEISKNKLIHFHVDFLALRKELKTKTLIVLVFTEDCTS